MSKKIVSVGLFILYFLLVQAFVFGSSEMKPIKNTDYYVSDIDGYHYITDINGKRLTEAISEVVKYEGGGYIVCYNTEDERLLKCTVLNSSFEPVIPIKYSSISYNDNTKCFECYYKTDKGYTDFYDSSFNKVEQPVDIRPVECTDYYCLRVLDERYSIDNEIYFICDSKGNILVEEGYIDVRGLMGCIVVTKFVDKQIKVGLYDKNLKLYNAIRYMYVSYDVDSQRIKLDDGVKADYLPVEYKPEYAARRLDNSELYIIVKDDMYYICNEKGEIIRDTGYYTIEAFDSNKILVRDSNKYPRKYSIIDGGLNTVISDYYRIEENDYGQILAYNNDSVDIYDKNFNKVGTEKRDRVFVTPVEGLEGKYIYNMWANKDEDEAAYFFVDGQGNALTRAYDSISEAQPGNLFIAKYTNEIRETTTSVINSECKVIATELYKAEVMEENGVVFVKGNSGKDVYYDVNGNIYQSKEEVLKFGGNSGDMSPWAKESIQQADSLGIIPPELKSAYKKNITRQEFCRLAMCMYTAKTGDKIPENARTPFGDVSDDYVTAAYNLGIVKGTGYKKFSPDKYITRQEAAVMLNNLAKVLEIEDTPKKDKFVDESYFADWAKKEIYSVAGMKSGDGYVMAGTGNGKFSPWMNYTREQAIATMLRLYNCG